MPREYTDTISIINGKSSSNLDSIMNLDYDRLFKNYI